MTEYHIASKTFAGLTTEELYELLKARFAVFVAEQRCFYLDMDDIDYRSTHFFIRKGQAVVAYGRLFEEEEPHTWHIGRVLTLERRTGMGRRLMEAIIRTAREQGAKTIRIEAQTHAVGFYEQLGFTACSEPFDEAGIEHIRMVLNC